MKVLITGGCGFLGSNIASSFLSPHNQVVVFDSLFRSGSALNLEWLKSKAKDSNFLFIQDDLANQEAVLKAFRRYGPFDYICHVGGQVAMTTSLADPRRDLETNILGTFNILEAMRLLSPNALLAYSSTNKVYGDLEHLRYVELSKRFSLADYPDGLDETLSLDFSTPYGCSKGSADQYVRDWARVYGLKTVVFRHSSIYGGRQYASFDQGWIGWFCQKALEQQFAFNHNLVVKPFTIAGSGKQVRDVLHADDLIRLYHAAFEKKTFMNGEIFNIGGGKDNSLSLLELFDVLSELLAIPPLRFDRLDRRASDQDCFIANIDKANKLLSWVPSVSYLSGISSMLDWTKNNFCVDKA